MSMPFFDAEQLIRLNRVSAYAVSPCGTWAAVAVARLDGDGGKYVSDLWRVPVSGGPAIPLTRGDSDDTAPSFRRDGALGFLSNRRLGDKPGDRKQVWLLHPSGGDPAPLTDEALGVSAFRFAQSAPALVCVAGVLPGVDATKQQGEADLRKRRGPTLLRYRRSPVRFWDHWLPEEAPHLISYADDGTGRRDLTPDATREFQIELAFAVDPLGRFVIATSAHPADDRIEDVDLVRIPLTGGDAVSALGAHHAVHASPTLSPDGRWLAATRNVRSPNAHGPVTLVLTDLETGHSRQLTGLERWLSPQCFSADGRALYAVCDDQGHTPVFRVDLETGELSRVSSTASGAHYASVTIIPGSDRLAALRDHFFSPPELVSIGTSPESEPTVLSTLSGFDGNAAQQHVVITSQLLVVDGRPVQSWFAAPTAAATPGPGLVWVHGGPHTQWTDAWHWRWNVLAAVARGYTVALPNPAGSTGFGQALVEDV
ncbi:MAG: PD40 domain-containing protein, partial [Myxococcales bacterium]|nr:PD40 domain-containing protein [Myxococcales bacterium]